MLIGVLENCFEAANLHAFCESYYSFDKNKAYPDWDIPYFLAERFEHCCRYRIARRKGICSRSATAATP